LRSNFSIDYLKENLPGQTGYLSIQMSEDVQNIFVAFC